jgi:hypothetical protein
MIISLLELHSKSLKSKTCLLYYHSISQQIVVSSSCCCSLIDGDKGTDGEVEIEGTDSGDVVVVTFLISSIIVVMLLSMIGDSCCCCCSEVDVVPAKLFVDVIVQVDDIRDNYEFGLAYVLLQY